MLVHVTQEDIDNATAKSCTYCPVAIAMTKILAEGLTVHVLTQGMKIWKMDDGWWRTQNPPEVVQFIKAFDRRDPVSPFSFEVDVPAKCLKEVKDG